jgi:Zn-dependent metalloprotease
MPSSSQPWYGRAPAAVALLVLFPPVGVYLMWRFQGWDARTKRLVTGGAVIWTAGIIASIVVAVVLAGGGGGGEQAAAVSPQEAALRELEKDSERPLNTYYQNGFPRFVQASVPVQGADAVERARNYLRTYRDLYLQSDPNLALAVRDTRGPGEDGLEHVIFYQMFRGYPVYAGEIVVSLDGDRVYASVGGLLSDVVLNTIPSISPREAEDIARDAAGLAGAPIFGETGLLVFDRGLLEDVPSDPHMAWEVTLSDRDPWRVFVDAHTGEVLLQHSLSPSDKDYDLDLEDANGAQSDGTGCYWWTSDNDYIGDEDGIIEDYLDDPQAANAWWYYHWAYDFYYDTFDQHSYNDDDGELEVYIHSSADNAAWIGGPDATDCDLIEFRDGWVAYDVMVHEFNHGVLSYRAVSNPYYVSQSGALNESLSDTFAYLADPDCPHGEDVVGGPTRNFCDPPARGQPDRFSEWVSLPDTKQGDYAGVHTNDGILNKAAYLLAEGGTHPDTGVKVTGIGRPKLGVLYYTAEANVTSGFQFIDWRNTVVGIADQWAVNGTNGFNTWAACYVRNAFFAVELGNGDHDCDGIEDPVDPDDDNDGEPDASDNCTGVYNPGQQDNDGDGPGDACDPDDDNDGVLDVNDNCDFVPSSNQKDSDYDGKGDVCDDDDHDGVIDVEDNCPNDYNPGQENVDPQNDDEGDACDPDEDGDGLSSDNDNCFLVPNPDQANSDGDISGDVCDPCPDVAGETYASANICIQTIEETICHYSPVFDDSDGDTIPDACDDSVGVKTKETPAKKKFLTVSAESMEVDVEAKAKTYQKIPLEPCPPLPDGVGTNGVDEQGFTLAPADMQGVITPTHQCMEALPQDELALLVLTGMDPSVRAWVSDDEGRTFDSRFKGDTRVFRFRPQGGRKYFLFLAFGPAFEPGQRVTFSAMMTTGPAEEQTGPTPSGASPTPAVVPPPPGTPTPTPTATATPTPGATPTPSATPTETATATAVITAAPTATAAPSAAPTATPAPTPSPTATRTPTPSPSPTLTPTTTPAATATPAPTPQEQTFTAIADSWVDARDPASTSGGSDPTLFVVDSLTPLTARSFLQFDLSSISSSATISQATLRLFYDTCVFGPDEVDVGAYGVGGPWTESTLSWNAQPAFAWDAEDVMNMGCEGATGGYVQWDITGLAQDWVSGSAPNYGVVVKAVDELGERGRLLARFGSRERAVGQQPQLIVSYVE